MTRLWHDSFLSLRAAPCIMQTNKRSIRRWNNYDYYFTIDLRTEAEWALLEPIELVMLELDPIMP